MIGAARSRPDAQLALERIVALTTSLDLSTMCLRDIMSGTETSMHCTNNSCPFQRVPPPLKSSVRTGPNPVLFSTQSPEPRTRTIQSSGRTEPELNRTVSSVLPVLVLCVGSGLNFGNPTQVGRLMFGNIWRLSTEIDAAFCIFGWYESQYMAIL